MKFGIFEINQHPKEVIDALIYEFNHISEMIEFTSNLNEADYIISLGGDGTLLDCFQRFSDKIVIPVRDYNLCNTHQNFNSYGFIDKIENFDVLEMSYEKENGNSNEIVKKFGISEIVIRNNNVSQAIRFDLSINGKIYALNIIGDGIIVCTTLGSTGYFQNVTNTIFTHGIGIGFINNSQRMSNLVLSPDDKISIHIRRGNCQACIDHNVFNVFEGDYLSIQKSCNVFKMINYKKNFMCYNCRNARHSAYVNNIYKVI